VAVGGGADWQITRRTDERVVIRGHLSRYHPHPAGGCWPSARVLPGWVAHNCNLVVLIQLDPSPGLSRHQRMHLTTHTTHTAMHYTRCQLRARDDAVALDDAPQSASDCLSVCRSEPRGKSRCVLVRRCLPSTFLTRSHA
jgi:hypothetical protein